jgi:Transcriptional regulator
MGSDERREEDEIFAKLPPGIALSWGIVKQPRRGPKGELSIAKIVDAAIEIADREGLSSLSMSKVAQALGFTTMSLYRYIKGKEELLVLMQDAVCRIPIPPEDAGKSWRQEMREYFEAGVGVFRRHPWYGETSFVHLPMTPGNLAAIDWLLRIMRNLPLTDTEKMSFMLLIASYVRACGLAVIDSDRAEREGASPDAFIKDAHAAMFRLVSPDRFPYLSQVMMSGAYSEDVGDSELTGLDFGFERIMDSIEYYVQRKM